MPERVGCECNGYPPYLLVTSPSPYRRGVLQTTAHLRVCHHPPSGGRSGISSRSLLRGVIQDREPDGGWGCTAARQEMSQQRARCATPQRVQRAPQTPRVNGYHLGPRRGQSADTYAEAQERQSDNVAPWGCCGGRRTPIDAHRSRTPNLYPTDRGRRCSHGCKLSLDPNLTLQLVVGWTHHHCNPIW